jgi:hypothetical protein
VLVHEDDIKTHEQFFIFLINESIFVIQTRQIISFAIQKVILFESHHVQKAIAASHFKNAEKPPQIFHFLKRIKSKTVRSLLKFVIIKNYFRKSCVMCVPHQNFNKKKMKCYLPPVKA